MKEHLATRAAKLSVFSLGVFVLSALTAHAQQCTAPTANTCAASPTRNMNSCTIHLCQNGSNQWVANPDSATIVDGENVQVTWVRDGGGNFNVAFQTAFQGSTSYSNNAPTSSGNQTAHADYTYSFSAANQAGGDPHVIVVGTRKRKTPGAEKPMLEK